ncbi:hypothetical protein [Gelria sp. Kuro-4]|uniref:hypothetical protein n=1 Tax=Gelria sp. Kuro-4 TaxID=2796927 RepID=UPI001BEDE6CE|nr:hypothetical protein [Gelria sp. Kuro-4]BCV23267.1 hypothetical protein kuro4_00400 [Gelria sp. Kuro-4]
MRWFSVRVYFPATPFYEAFTHEDEILGVDPEDALKRAYWNWPEAEKVEVL